MNIESTFKQLQALQKDGLEDSDKYKELYNQLKIYQNHPIYANGWNQEEKAPQEEDGEMSVEAQNQLQRQILAYKGLVRNMPLPKDLESESIELTKDQWKATREKLLMKSVKGYYEKPEKYDELKKIISHYNQSKKSTAPQNPTEPGQPPAPFEVDQKAIDYVERNNYFIERRKHELNRFMNSDALPDETKLRVSIEAKFLESLQFYDKLKDVIFKNVLRNKPKRTFEKMYLDRKFFTRERPPKRFDHRMLDRPDFHLRSEQDQRKKMRHREFFRDLHQHQTMFFEFHKKKNKAMKKRLIGYKTYFENIEKRKQEERDKETKDRVKALREKDFDAYMDLVTKAKNTRILELLKQTEEFMRQLGAKVKIQRGEGINEKVDDEAPPPNEENLAQSLKNSTKVYYDLTQSNKEEIKEQPSLLEGGSLKKYQMAGLEWMVSLYNNKLNGILADEMGLGKTIQTISLFCYLMESKNNYGPFLIVVPLSTLPNWVLEFDKWAPSIKKIAYKGAPQTRKQLATQLKTTKWNVCLTTYEYILKDKFVLNKFNWQYIIIDEGHRMKNNKSKFTQTLGQEYNSEHRILLTGTPLQNNLTELWSLLNFLLPKVFNSSDEFEKWFSLAVTKYTNEKEAQLTEEEQLLIINRLHQVLRPFLLRRIKKEVAAEIPNKVEYVIKVELSPWQKIVYEQLRTNGVLTRDPNGKVAARALMNLMIQLRKICDHPYLFLDSDYYIHSIDDMIFRVAGKFELLDRILPKLITAKHRILIFCQMTHVMDVLQLYFNYRGLRHLRLDGSTKADERGERVALFNKPDSEFDIFLLSTRAGGLGLNLQTADTVILFDSDWNPQMDLQAQDRAHRIGAKSEVRVLRLVTNTWIEEQILDKAAFKQNMDEILIQAGMYNDRSTDTERREKLEDLLKKQASDSDSDDEIPDDEQINEMLSRGEEEFNFYQQMDQERYEREKHIYPSFRYPQKGDGKFHNYRLISPEDVPSWVKEDVKAQEEQKEYGRGNRARKQVSYKFDMMSDEQWIKAMEEGETFSDTSEKKKRKTRSQKYQSEDEPGDVPKRSLRKKRTTARLEESASEENYMEEEDDEQIYQENDDEYDGGEKPNKKSKRLKKLKKNAEINNKEKSEEEAYASTD